MVDKPALDDVLKALADPTRRAMIQRLSGGEHTVGEIAQPLAMSLAGASKHIGILEAAGLIARESRGRERVCKLRPLAFEPLRQWVAHYGQFWDARFDALDAALRAEMEEDGHG